MLMVYYLAENKWNDIKIDDNFFRSIIRKSTDE